MASRGVRSYGDKALAWSGRTSACMAHQTRERDSENQGRRCPYRLSDHLSSHSTHRLFAGYVLVREARIYPEKDVRTLSDRLKTNTQGFTVMKPVAKTITSKGICSPGWCGSFCGPKNAIMKRTFLCDNALLGDPLYTVPIHGVIGSAE